METYNIELEENSLTDSTLPWIVQGTFIHFFQLLWDEFGTNTQTISMFASKTIGISSYYVQLCQCLKSVESAVE